MKEKLALSVTVAPILFSVVPLNCGRHRVDYGCEYAHQTEQMRLQTGNLAVPVSTSSEFEHFSQR
ncbi:MAG: hypothetical protein ACOH1R_11090 [Luteimonas sp.]